MPSFDLNTVKNQVYQINTDYIEQAKNKVQQAISQIDNSRNTGNSEPAIQGLNQAIGFLNNIINQTNQLKIDIDKYATDRYYKELREEREKAKEQ